MIAFPLRKQAFATALLATLGLSAVATVTVLVRTLPWLLSTTVPLGLALPFAKSLLLVACEASLLIGVPMGFSLAASRFVERGEARVYVLLGESPLRSALRLVPALAPLLCALGLVSFLGGRDSARPGGVVTELIAAGQRACVHSAYARTVTVPFVSATWLCVPGTAPRLVGRAPLGDVWYAADSAEFSGDLREVALAHAEFSFVKVGVDVGEATLRGLPSFLPASQVEPRTRTLWLALAAAACALCAVWAQLQWRVRRGFGPLLTLALGATGPAAALALFHVIEKGHYVGVMWTLVPLLGGALMLVLFFVASHLPSRGRTGTSTEGAQR